MKALVDNPLPRILAAHLRRWGWDCIHVRDIQMEKTDDESVWSFAIEQNRLVISKDEDFLRLVSRSGDRGRLVWVRAGNCSNYALLSLFDRERERLVAALNASRRVIEV